MQQNEHCTGNNKFGRGSHQMQNWIMHVHEEAATERLFLCVCVYIYIYILYSY